jgi:hypothetical protein
MYVPERMIALSRRGSNAIRSAGFLDAVGLTSSTKSRRECCVSSRPSVYLPVGKRQRTHLLDGDLPPFPRRPRWTEPPTQTRRHPSFPFVLIDVVHPDCSIARAQPNPLSPRIECSQGELFRFPSLSSRCGTSDGSCSASSGLYRVYE